MGAKGNYRREPQRHFRARTRSTVAAAAFRLGPDADSS